MDFGVDDLHFLLFHGGEFVESLLGAGQRWGGTFHYHYRPSRQSVYPWLGALIVPRGDGEVILLAHADRLPAIERQMAEPPGNPTFWMSTGDVPEWTGWALVTYQMLQTVPPGANASECFRAWRDQTRNHARFFSMPRPLTASSFEHLLNAQHRVLSKEHRGLVLTGREVEDQVWMGRNVNVHRTAKLISPVYIGENCRIGFQTQLGPGVSVGRGSVVDRFSTVENSMIYAGSYIGEGLEVRDAIVSGNHLFNTRIGAAIHDVDHVLLAHLSGPPLGSWLGLCRECLLAALLLAVAWPVLVGMLLWKLVRSQQWPLEARELLAQPAFRRPERWRPFRQWTLKGDPRPGQVARPRRQFFHVFLPGLWNVMRGELCMTGPSPLTLEQARQVAPENPERLRRKPGLIHPGLWDAPEESLAVNKQGLWTRYLAALWKGRY